MDFPVPQLPPPPILTPFHPDAGMLGGMGSGHAVLGGTSSVAWPTANLALFVPFRLFMPATAYQLLFLVGATGAGNVDVGIYDSQKNLIVSSGSTLMSLTASTWQELNITDTLLLPGDYLLAAACSLTTATCFRGTANDEVGLATMPLYEQASAFPLPATCNPVPVTNVILFRFAYGIQFVPTF
jgi:hypothetical protein